MLQGFYLLAMQRARRRRRILALACSLALVSAGLAAHARSSPGAAQATSAPLPYVAQSEDGRLIVSRGGEVLLRTAIDVRTLPTADRDALSQGIVLADAQALAKLLEDLGS